MRRHREVSVDRPLPTSFRSNHWFSVAIFLSGFAAISYEILWLRRLGLVLGSDSTSIAIILASFMAGLGLGSSIFGKVADIVDPMRLYRLLEMGLAVLGLSSLWFLSSVRGPFALLDSLGSTPWAHSDFVRFTLAFVLLSAPTLLMGGTLPAAIKFLSENQPARFQTISLAYGVNTLGAAAAAFAVPFIFLPTWTVTSVVYLAAAANLASLIATLGVRRRRLPHVDASTSPSESAEPTSRLRVALLLATVAATGFLAISLETVWNRVFSIFFTGSIYTFSTILLAYLVFVALGSLAYHKIRFLHSHPDSTLVGSLLVVSILATGSSVFLDQIPLLQLRILDSASLDFGSFVGAMMICSIVFIAPICAGFGLSFPAGAALLTRELRSLGFDSGRYLLLNTLGSSAASLVVTFFLFAALGSERLLLYASAAIGLVALVAAGATGRLRAASVVVAAVLALHSIFPLRTWNQQNFQMLLAQDPQRAVMAKESGKLEELRQSLRLVDLEEGPTATASVVRAEGIYEVLLINGKPDAGEHFRDMKTQYSVGFLPLLMHPRPPDELSVIVVGLGSGSTTRAAETFHPRELTTVEISKEVISLSRRYFQKANQGAPSRTQVIAADGRNYLLRNQRRWDVIISEPSNPWITGVSNLFTKEYFELAASRLNPDGVFCQWIQLYSTAPEALTGVFNTLRATFPYTYGFLVNVDFVIVASRQPLDISSARIANLSPDTTETLASLGLHDPLKIFESFAWTPEIGAQVTSQLPHNSDEQPWLEFRAPRYVFSLDRNSASKVILERIVGRAVSAPFSPKLEITPNSAIFSDDRIRLDGKFRALGKPTLEVRWLIPPSAKPTIAYRRFPLEESPTGTIDVYLPVERRQPSQGDLATFLQLFLDLSQPIQKAGVQVAGHAGIALRISTGPSRILASWYCDRSRQTIAVDLKGTVAADFNRILAGFRCHDR